MQIQFEVYGTATPHEANLIHAALNNLPVKLLGRTYSIVSMESGPIQMGNAFTGHRLEYLTDGRHEFHLQLELLIPATRSTV